jgi:ribosomal protein S18 acetylase RimI-like enzyme
VRVTTEVRDATPDEFEEAGRVTAEAYREFAKQGDEDWARYLTRLADVRERADRTTILVALEEGRIVGSVTLELEGRVSDWDDDPPLGDGEAHIRMLGVDPGARGRGIGPALMAASEERARAAGKRVLTLNTTRRMRAAQAMYERLGYERGEDVVFPDGFVLLSYSRELSLTSAEG